MKKLTLRLLGVPEIHLDGRPLRFPTRKAQALLIYLAVEGGLHSRASLTALFWPESSPKLARAAFRNTLARLRKNLDDGARLLVKGDLIGLRQDETMQIDVYEVAALAAPMNNLHTGVALTTLNCVGGDFLDGFTLGDSPEFDNWVSLKREYYYQLIDQLFDRLSQRSTQGKRAAPSPSFETVLAWVKHNPISERAYHRLIELYLEAGDRSSALNIYQTYCTTLKTQLGLEPSGQIQALAASLHTQAKSKLPSILNDQQLNALEIAISFVANDAVFINPTGYYAGREIIYRHLRQTIARGTRFQVWNFRVVGCCVIYNYRVSLNSLLDAFEDGATVVCSGKIIFDGTLRSAPPDLLELAHSSTPDQNAVEIVKAYYRGLNAEVSP